MRKCVLQLIGTPLTMFSGLCLVLPMKGPRLFETLYLINDYDKLMCMDCGFCFTRKLIGISALAFQCTKWNGAHLLCLCISGHITTYTTLMVDSNHLATAIKIILLGPTVLIQTLELHCHELPKREKIFLVFLLLINCNQSRQNEVQRHNAFPVIIQDVKNTANYPLGSA